MHGVDTSSVSLRREFGAYLSRIKEANGGKSRRDDFRYVASQLFPQYGEAGEELVDFMSRAGKLLSKRRHAPQPSQQKKRMRPKKRPLTLEEVQTEILKEIEQRQLSEQDGDVRPRPTDPRDLPAWIEVEGEVLPPSGAE